MSVVPVDSSLKRPFLKRINTGTAKSVTCTQPTQNMTNRLPLETPNFDPQKVDSIYKRLVETFSEAGLTTEEIVVAYGNLGYALGASVHGISEGKGPSPEELRKLYYTTPTIGVALMSQGMEITSWFKQLQNLRESKS